MTRSQNASSLIFSKSISESSWPPKTVPKKDTEMKPLTEQKRKRTLTPGPSGVGITLCTCRGKHLTTARALRHLDLVKFKEVLKRKFLEGPGSNQSAWEALNRSMVDRHGYKQFLTPPPGTHPSGERIVNN